MIKKLITLVATLAMFASIADAAFVVQQGRTEVTAAQQDIPITSVNAMSRAFVIITHAAGYHNGNEDSDENCVRGYLQATNNIRVYRGSAADSSWISWQVIECTGDEFEAFRGSGSFSSAAGDVSASIGATVNTNACFAWVTADSDQNNRNNYCQSELTAYVNTPTTVRIQRGATGSAAPNYNWAVVEFDTNKIASIQHGLATVTTQTQGAPSQVTISPVNPNSSILLFQSRSTVANGVTHSAVAGRLANTNLLEFYVDNQYLSGTESMEYYVIDFGGNAAAQRGTIDYNDTSTWLIADASLSNSVTLARAMHFHSNTCVGNDSDKNYPRPFATAEFTSTSNLRIQRMRSGAGSWIEWQVLELPQFLKPSVGYVSDDVIPATQLNQATNGSGEVTVTYKIKDPQEDYCSVATTSFYYRVNDGSWLSVSNAHVQGTKASLSSASEWVSATEHTLVWLSTNYIPDSFSTNVQFMFRVSDGGNESEFGVSDTGFDVDNLKPSLVTATHFETNPVAGDATITINSSWSEQNPDTSTFYFDLNGGGYDSGTAGTGNANDCFATISIGATLNGNDYFHAVKSLTTDDFGNQSPVSEVVSDVGVKPYQPAAPHLTNATAATIDVTVNRNASEVEGLNYAIYITPSVGGGNWVQADGSIAGAEVWRSVSVWGQVTLTGLDPGTEYTVQTKSRNANVTSVESDLSPGSSLTTAYAPVIGYVADNVIPASMMSQATDGSGEVTFTFRITDQDVDSCSVVNGSFYYSTNGSAWIQVSDAHILGTRTGLSSATNWSGAAEHSLVWASWSYVGGAYSPDARIKFRVSDGSDNSAEGVSEAGFDVDNIGPVISDATHFETNPVAGDATVTLNSVWHEHNPDSSVFFCDLNGSGYGVGTAGSGDSTNCMSTITLPVAINGTSYFSAVKSGATDDFGNTSVWSEVTTDVGVKPYQPASPTVSDATVNSVDLSVNANPSEASGLEYAIYVTPAVGGNNWVQADGSIGGSEVWRDISTWGTVTVTGLDYGTEYTFQTRSRNSLVNAVVSDLSPGTNITTESNCTIGYSVDHVIPFGQMSQATNGSGNVSIVFKIKDAEAELCYLVGGSFEYQVDAGGWTQVSDAHLSGSKTNLTSDGTWGAAAEHTLVWAGTNYIPGAYSEDVQVRFRVSDGNGISPLGTSEAGFDVDNMVPSNTVQTYFDVTPAAGDTSVQLGSTWQEHNPDAFTFYHNLNGGGYDSGTVANTNDTNCIAGIDVGFTLNGTDYFAAVKSVARDDFGNVSAESENPSSVGVVPYIPAAMMVTNATGYTMDVSVNRNPLEAVGLEYSISVTVPVEGASTNWVQSDGTLGESVLWQTTNSWGSLTVTNLGPSTKYVFRARSRNMYVGSAISAPSAGSTGITAQVSNPVVGYNESDVIPIPQMRQATNGSGDVTITYKIRDAQEDTCDYVPGSFYYQIDEGGWISVSDGHVSGAKTALTSATNWPQASDHTFVWMSTQYVDNTYSTNVQLRFRVNDGSADSSYGISAQGFDVDDLPPSIATGTHFETNPVAGDTSILLNSVWNEQTPYKVVFNYDLNAGGYGSGTTFVTNSFDCVAPVSLGVTLNGTNYFTSVKSSATDALGNQSSESENLTDVGVKPYMPAPPSVSGPATNSLDVDVNRNASEAVGLSYAIRVDPAVGGNNWVQADGTVGASEVWRTRATWGTVTVTGLAEGSNYTFRTKSRNLHVTSVESDLSTNAAGTTTMPAHIGYVEDEVIPAAQLVQAVDGSGDVTVTYRLRDAYADVCSVVNGSFYYQVNGGGWNAVADAHVVGTKAGLSSTGVWAEAESHELTWCSSNYIPNAESADVQVRFKVNDGTDDSAYGVSETGFDVDNLKPVEFSATAFATNPVAGDTSIVLKSVWTESSPDTSMFFYNLNAAGYDAGTAGTVDSTNCQAEIAVGLPLDGTYYFTAVKSRAVDDFGNQSDESEDTTDVGVKPYTPAAPTVTNATEDTIDVSVNRNPSAANSLEYAIYVTPAVGGNNWVQGDGTIGVSEVWQTTNAWGQVTVTNLQEGTEYTFKTKSRNLFVNSVESDLSPGAVCISTYAPVIGYLEDNIIPVSQMSQATNGSGDVTFSFRVRDPDLDLCSVVGGSFFYQVNGGGWNAISDTHVTGTKTDLSSSATWGGAVHSLVWLSSNYIPNALSTDVQLRFRVSDGVNTSGQGTSDTGFDVDNLKPAIALATHFEDQPLAGDTTISLNSVWDETNPNTSVFYYNLNGGGYDSGTAGTANSSNCYANAAVGQTLNGTNYFTGLRSSARDDFGNQSEVSEDTTNVGVKPYTPSVPTVENPKSTSMEVSVNKYAAEADGLLYAIYVTPAVGEAGNNWVQANGSVSDSEVWQSISAWGTMEVTGLDPETTYTFRTKSRNMFVTSVESDLSSGASKTTTTPGQVGVVSGYHPLRQASDRHTFYDGSGARYWAFYLNDDHDIVYEKSSDGVNWGNDVSVISEGSYNSVSVWEDATYAWLSYCNGIDSYVRRVTIASDTLDTEQVVTNATAHYHSQVVKDSSGYLWRKGELPATTPNYYSASDSSAATNSTTTWDNRLNLTFTPAESSDWVILVSFEIASGAASFFVESRLQVNDADVGDSDDAFWQTRSSAPDEFHNIGFVHYMTGVSSQQSIDLDYRINKNNAAAVIIRNPSIIALRADVAGSDVSWASQSTASQDIGTSWTTRLSNTFTPCSSGKYLVVAYANFEEDSTSDSAMARVYDGSTYSPIIGNSRYWSREGLFSDERLPFFDMQVVDLSSGSQTISLQTAASSGTSIDVYGQRLLAMRLDGVFEYETSETPAQASTTSQTRQVRDTLNTSLLGDVLLLGKIYMQGSTTANGFETAVEYDDTDIAQMEQSPANTTDYYPCSVMKMFDWTSGHKLETAYCSVDAAGTTYVKNSMLLAIQLQRTAFTVQRSTAPNNYASWGREYVTGIDPSDGGHCVMVPYGAGVMCVAQSGNELYSRSFTDPGSQGSRSLVTTSINNGSSNVWGGSPYFSAVTDSSNQVHVLYQTLAGDIDHVVCSSSAWGTPTNIASGDLYCPGVSLFSPGGTNEIIYGFWVNNDISIDYRAFDVDNGAWGVTTWTLESDLLGTEQLSCNYSDDEKIGVIWLGEGGSIDLFYASPMLATYVSLSWLEAVGRDDAVTVRWKTETEVNNAGFNIYRSSAAFGPYTRVNSEFIWGLGSSTRGREYKFDDNSVTNGVVYYYKLEAVEYDGRSEVYGPVQAHPGLDSDDDGMTDDWEDFYGLDKNVNDAAVDSDGDGITNIQEYLADTNPKVDEGINGQGWLNDPPSTPTAGDSGIWKMAVEEDGVYRITHDYLLGTAGITNLADWTLDNARIYCQGVEIPINISNSGGAGFDAGDYIEFYGEGIDSIFTKQNIYWLFVADSPGVRMSSVSGVSGSVATNCLYTLHYEVNDYYQDTLSDDSPDDDHWFDGSYFLYAPKAPPPTSADIDLTLTNVSPGDVTATVRVTLRGINYTSRHHVEVSVNGVPLPDGWWNGNSEYTYSASVSQTNLSDGINTITVVLPGDTGEPIEQVLVNWAEIDYLRGLATSHNNLLFDSRETASREYRVNGYTTNQVDVFRVQGMTNVAMITDASVQGAGPYSVVFSDNTVSGVTYAVVGNGSRSSPVSIMEDRDCDLRSTTNAADYIMITYHAFADHLAPLAARRVSQGMRVKIVDVQDVYDDFNHGISSPYAIRDFLRYVREHWEKPAPAYVLLVGDASYDYKDNEDLGTVNYVPVKMQHDVESVEVPCDNWFVALDENDFVPDMYVGRFPARNTNDVNVMVGKTLAYEDTASDEPWARRVMLVADDEPRFEMMSDSVYRYLPDGFVRDKIYLSEYPSGVACRTAVVNGINQGALVTHYSGHGSIQLWADEQILREADIASLTNSVRLPLVITPTCYNGYFIFPNIYDYESMAEQLLRRSGGGAVACLSPSGLSQPPQQEIIVDCLFDTLFKDGVFRIGPAVARSKLKAYQRSGDGSRNVVQTFDLFGDPSLSLKKWSGYTNDVSVPYVVCASPTNNAEDVGVYSDIEIEFSENMDDIITRGAFSITPYVQGAFEWSGSTLVFNPDGYLDSTLTYTVSVLSNACDLAGNCMNSGICFSFSPRLPNVSGTVNYAGLHGGRIHVLVTDSHDDLAASTNCNARSLLDAPGSYACDELFPGSYWIWAFMDSDGNGLWNPGEPAGVCQLSPLTMSSTDVSGADITLVDTDQDADMDGLTDWEETEVYGTSNSNADSDGDGLRDGYDEVRRYRTDPAESDTDGDDVSDGVEVAAATDPLDPDSFPTGTITINVTPDNGSWMVAQHPSSYIGPTNGVGDLEETEVRGSTYSIEYQSIPECTPPAPQTLAVEAGRLTAFSGAYNHYPVINEGSSVSVSLSDETPFSLTLHASDQEGDDLAWSIAVQATNGTASASGTGLVKSIAYAPDSKTPCQDSFVVRVTDIAGGYAEIVVNVSVMNEPPSIDPVPDQTVDEGKILAVTLTASDPGGDSLVFSVADGPGAVSGDVYKYAPDYTAADDSPYDVTVRATDPYGGSDETSFKITVNPVNAAPVLGTLTDKSDQVGKILTFDVTAIDPDGTVPLLTMPVSPKEAAFADKGNGTGTFTWQPADLSDIGDHKVRFVASDGTLSDSKEIIVHVSFVNVTKPADDQIARLGTTLRVEWVGMLPLDLVDINLWRGTNCVMALAEDLPAPTSNMVYDTVVPFGVNPGRDYRVSVSLAVKGDASAESAEFSVLPPSARDFDGDGRSDLAVFYPAGNCWYVWRTSEGFYQTSFGYAGGAPAVGDFDGDGKADPVIYDSASGAWYVLQSSNGQMYGDGPVVWGFRKTVPVPADYDGDGKTDFAVYHSKAGCWYIIYSGGGRLVAYNWGWSDAVPVPGDYDGDGKADMAVYHAPSGGWYVLCSADGNLLGYNWGWNDALPVPADYDGDGRTDVAVYDWPRGNWHILYSAGGVLNGFNWGWNEVLPVPADYDGDGKVDMAVYHWKSGNWYILQSSSNAIYGNGPVNWGFEWAMPPVQECETLNWFESSRD